MERLTRRTEDGKSLLFVDYDNDGLLLEPQEMFCGDIDKALKRLAEYEDTGLEPHEITPSR